MSISRQNLSIVIVTLKSEKVINQCIDSIGGDLPIIERQCPKVVEISMQLEETTKIPAKGLPLECLASLHSGGLDELFVCVYCQRSLLVVFIKQLIDNLAGKVSDVFSCCCCLSLVARYLHSVTVCWSEAATNVF